MLVKVGISNRHIHLNQEDFSKLFKDEKLTKRNDLSQMGEFASFLVVTIKGPKGIIENVRVLGPLRNYTQVEVSKTDCYKLGIDAPIKDSGDLVDAAEITIESKQGSITKNCCIIPIRHIHISPKEQQQFNLFDPPYKIKVMGKKGGILTNIKLRVDENYNFELHLDTDDANAFLLKQGDFVEVGK